MICFYGVKEEDVYKGTEQAVRGEGQVFSDTIPGLWCFWVITEGLVS